MRFQKFVVDKDYPSVYIFLKQHGFSENYIKNLRKKHGDILLNGQIVHINQTLCERDILETNASPNTKSGIMRCILGLDVVYEDEYYLIVNKPSGLSCMPNRSHYAENLAGAICNYMDKKSPDFVLRIINRLDKDTAGLIIVAKDSVAQKELQNIQKTYHALVHGKIDTSLIIDKPIATLLNTDGFNQHKRLIAKNGKPAKTFVTPLQYFEDKDITLISCTLEHGRTHQIRIHLSSIGHPLIGDNLYGDYNDAISSGTPVHITADNTSPQNVFSANRPKEAISVVKKTLPYVISTVAVAEAEKSLQNSNEVEKFLPYILPHAALVCKKVAFTHPFTQKQITLEVDYPNDIKTLIKKD